MNKVKINGKVLAIQLGRVQSHLALLSNGTIQHSVTVETPSGAVEDGMIRNQDAVRAMLKLVLNDEQFAGVTQAVFSLCTSQVITETVTTPNLPLPQLEKLLVSNADMYFPVDMKEYQMVWQVIAPKTSDNGLRELSVQLWAVPLAMLSRYYSVGNACGLSVVAVDYCGNSIATAVGAGYARSVKAAKVVKERKKLDLNMEISFKPKKKEELPEETEKDPQAPHYIPNTQMYISLYSDLLGMTFVQDDQVVQQRFVPCGMDPMDQVSELTMMLEYFRSLDVGRGSPLQGYLCGALVNDQALVQLLEDMLGMELKPVRELYESRWTVCVGAAATVLDFGNPSMNHPGKVRSQVGSQIWQYALVLVGGAVLVGAVLLTLSSRLIWDADINNLENKRLQLTIEAKNTSGYADNYNSYLSKYNSYSSDWDTIFGSMRTYNDNLVLVLEELEQTLPENTSVTNLQISANGLTVQFACENKEEAAYLIMALRQLQYADLQAISNLSGGGGGPATSYGPETEEPPTEGSYTVTATTDSLVEQILAEYLDEEELLTLAMSLSPTEIEQLENAYGYRPATSYNSLDTLKAVKNPTVKQRGDAIYEMVSTNPFVLRRLADLMEYDLLENDTPILMGNKVLEEMMMDPTLMNLVLGGGMEDPQQLLECRTSLAAILSKDEENITATEKLLATDHEMELWNIYYLEVELGLQAERKFPYLDMDQIIADLMKGSFDTGNKELDAKLNAMIPQEVWDMIANMNQPGDGPVDDPPAPGLNLSREDLAQLLYKYLTTGSTDVVIVDQAIENYLKNGDTGFQDANDLINDMMDEYMQTGTTGDKKLDAEIDKMIKSYMDTQTTGYPHLDKLIGTKVKQMLNKYLTTGTTGVEKWDDLIEEYLAGMGADPGENNGTSGDTRIYFTVQLAYNDELLNAELERKGMDYDAKVEKLEVFAE